MNNCKLRKKLAQAGADNLIGTVWSRGYMMRESVPARATAQDVTVAKLVADAEAVAAISEALATA